MSVEQSAGRSDTASAAPSREGSPRRSGGSHRAPRKGPSRLVLVLGAAVAAVLAVVVFLVLGGSGDTSAPDDEASAPAGAQARAGEAPAGDQADQAGAEGDVTDAGPGLATQQASVSAGEALARNPRLTLDDTERAELVEGRVDLRVLSLLALLGADFDLDVADFAAPDNPDGLRTAYVVDLGAVDGQPVTADPGQELARIATDQLGVYQPQTVTVEGGVLRITFAPRDSDDLPPVPMP